MSVIRIGIWGIVAAFSMCLISRGELAGSNESPLNANVYALVMVQEVESLEELEVVFRAHQDAYLPIVPPVEGFVLHQSRIHELTPVDMDLISPAFIKMLNGRYVNSVVVYPITLIENPVTRAIEIINDAGVIIHTIPATQGYDPYVYLKGLYPGLSSKTASADARRFLQAVYDPARIQLNTYLVAVEDVEHYLYAEQQISEAQTARVFDDRLDGGLVLLQMGEQTTNDIVITDLQTDQNPEVTVAYPVEFTNRLDIFATSDLATERWFLAARDLSTSGGNPLVWTDTNLWPLGLHGFRAYSVGNADIDSDGDGHSDAREWRVYQTDANDSNSRPFSVSGTISYQGAETGTIFVLASESIDEWTPLEAVTLPDAGSFTNPGVGGGRDYWFKAFRDVMADGVRANWEPWGRYSESALLVTGDTEGINIDLQDVPSVWGTLSYAGPQTGDVHVIAVAESNSWDALAETIIPWEQGQVSPTGGSVYLSFPVDYSLVGLPATDCWIRVFIDSNANSMHTFGEASGLYSSQSLLITSRITDINITLTDGDTDGDGMPDWWELEHHLNPVDSMDATADGDGDGLSNIDEYTQGTSPFELQDLAAPRAKILINGTGIYRIPKDDIANALDLTVNDVTNTTFSLRIQGTAVPTLRDAGDVLFYGEAYEDLYTAHNAYILSEGPFLAPSTRVVQVSTQTPATTYFDTTVIESNAFYVGKYVVTNTTDPWAWQSITKSSAKDFTVLLDEIDTSTTGSLVVTVVGYGTEDTRAMEVRLNGSLVGSMAWGPEYGAVELPFSVPNSAWCIGVNTVTVENVSSGFAYFAFDRAALTYPRLFALAPSQTLMTVSSESIAITNIGTNVVTGWDISDPRDPVMLDGFLQTTNTETNIRFSNSAEKLLFCFDGHEYEPYSVTPMETAELLAATTRADYLMIVGKGLEAQAANLAELRASNGLAVVNMPMEKVYDTIAFGRADGKALQFWMGYIDQVWEQPPTYVLLVGDASLDYKNHKGSRASLVPALPTRDLVYNKKPDAGIHASDEEVMDWNRDGWVDFAVGRLPLSDTNTLHQYIQTMLVYEAGGNWRTNMMIAVGEDKGELIGYMEMANELESIISNEVNVLRTTNREDVVESLCTGRDFIAYIGHGNGDELRGEHYVVLGRDDVFNLPTTNKPSLFLDAACNSGNFGEWNFDVIGEVLFRQPGVSSSVICAADNISSWIAWYFQKAFSEAMQVEKKVRVGDVLLFAHRLPIFHLYPENQTMHLFGDPGMIINP